MLSFFSRYRYKYNTYDTNLQKYIRKIEADLREKEITKLDKLVLHNHGNNNYIFMPIVGFICFLVGYNLSSYKLSKF
jgi:hypothetical protein